MEEKKYVTNDEDKYPVTILKTDIRGSDYPVLILVHSKVEDTVMLLSADFKFMSSKKPYIIEQPPYADFKDGDRVMVRNSYSERWYPRYFAFVSNDGAPTTYEQGATKWSSGGLTVSWHKCRRPTQEELRGV